MRELLILLCAFKNWLGTRRWLLRSTLIELKEFSFNKIAYSPILQKSSLDRHWNLKVDIVSLYTVGDGLVCSLVSMTREVLAVITTGMSDSVICIECRGLTGKSLRKPLEAWALIWSVDSGFSVSTFVVNCSYNLGSVCSLQCRCRQWFGEDR